jgi:hypothetical protein
LSDNTSAANREADSKWLEKRKHVRTPGNNTAAIIYAGRDLPPIMCTVADISDGGAGLTVASTNGVPDVFELEIKGEQARRSCKVAWKSHPHRLGVSFAGASEPFLIAENAASAQ